MNFEQLIKAGKAVGKSCQRQSGCPIGKKYKICKEIMQLTFMVTPSLIWSLL